MNRAATALLAATALAALAHGSDPAPFPIGAIVGATLLVVWGIVAERPARWGTRLAYGLLLGYVAVWGWTALTTERIARPDEDSATRQAMAAVAEVAGSLEDRLAADRALAERVARGLAASPPKEGEAAWFQALGRVMPSELPEGVGVELYDAAGGLRAWWGDPRGERLAPDSIAATIDRAVVQRSPGWVVAHSGVVVPVAGDTFRVVGKDAWAIESPFGPGAVEFGLPLADLARRHHLDFHLVPVTESATAVVRAPGGEAVVGLEARGFRLEAYVAERRRAGQRATAWLLLWPLIWALGTTWRGARRMARSLPWIHGKTAARVGAVATVRAALVALFVGFLVESRYPGRILPESWFSPLGFAVPAFGPVGRSAGDFVFAMAGVAMVAWTTWGLLRDRGARRLRPVPGGVALVGLPVLAWGFVRFAEPVIERALQGMSPSAFFSPTLLFAPPLLLVLLGFALFTAAAVVALAAGLRGIGVPDGPGWGAGAAGIAGVAVGIALWRLPGVSMAGHRVEVVIPSAVALASGAWAALAAGRPAAGGGRPRVVRLAVVSMAVGALVVLPLAAYARVQAAHELLVERAQRIGQTSTQWLDYTMTRMVEFLESDPSVREAIEEGAGDAALGLWSRSPVRELDFASGLFLFDAGGNVVSRFSLTAEDLTDRARRFASAVESARVAVRGSRGTGTVRWAVVPIVDQEGERIGTAVAMTTGAIDLREEGPGTGFVLTDLLAGAGIEPDAPGYTSIGSEEEAPPRTLLTRVRVPGEEREEGALQLAMPLDPLLPGPRTTAVFVLAAVAAGLALGGMERAGDPRARARWKTRLAAESPLRSFRAQLVLAFLAIAAVPLTLYAVLGYRATRLELQEATRSAAAEALQAASRMVVTDRVLSVGTSREISGRLREIGDALQQDLVLYWRGRTVASSRPEIFASRLFADRIEGEVYATLFAERQPITFDATSLGNRSFLVGYRELAEPDVPPGYVLATPLLIREDRVRADLERLGEGVFLLSAFSIGFLLIVGWGLARFMSRPLSALEAGARHIAAGHLSHRLPEPARRDEFGRVMRAFNTMAGRLDTSQRALEREKSRIQAILASVGAGVVALDGRGRIRLINDRAADLLGLETAEVSGRPLEEMVATADASGPFWRLVAEALGTGIRVDRDLVLRRDGEERHYHVACTGLVDGLGEERGLVVAFEDITGNVQSQRVLAWGEMARQVAHEIKNPLTPMKLSLQHLERTVEDRAPDFERVFRRNLERVLDEIDRLERIAGSFARFAVPQPAVVQPFDAVAVAGETVELFRTGDDAIGYRLEVMGEPRRLLGEEEGFRRILVNLLQNAREAVLAKPEPEGVVEVRLDFRIASDRARVSVLDDGVGLDDATAERLFEPSFSTKTRGTGLGLAITRRIVEAWEGSIDWRRRDGAGTEMRVELRTTGSPTPGRDEV